jgi:hypothetical protein
MAASYTVKLPDGNEYGPVDLPTLRSWHEEGRIGPDTWVWPEGSPEWLTLMDVLAGATQDAGEDRPLRFKEEPRPARARPTSPRPSPRPAPRPERRSLGLLLGVAAALLAVGAAVGFVLLAPRLEKERAGERTRADALPDRRFADESVGLALDLPEGWLLLKPDSTLFLAPEARARLAQPDTGAYAAVVVESLPPGVLGLDSFIDRVVEARRPLVSDYREVGRAEATVSGGRHARRLQASWIEGGVEQRVTLVAAQDAWAYVALGAWGPAKTGAQGQEALDALAKGLQLSGALGARVAQTAEALQVELPELSRASLELILRDCLGRGRPPEEAAEAAVRAVSQGLPALHAEEAQELQQIYALVYDPMAEADRQRLAAWQREVRAGRPVVPDEAQALRLMLRDALLAVPEESRLRLQGLNEKAIAAAYALR